MVNFTISKGDTNIKHRLEPFMALMYICSKISYPLKSLSTDVIFQNPGGERQKVTFTYHFLSDPVQREPVFAIVIGLKLGRCLLWSLHSAIAGQARHKAEALCI